MAAYEGIQGNITCPNPAKYRYTWPGQSESYVCEMHSVGLRNIAAAMGFHLQLIPVEETCEETCHQKLSKRKE